jgi:CubicO group peptidase (beta-lactamase class C family)
MKTTYLAVALCLTASLCAGQPSREIDSVLQIALRRGIFNGNALVVHRGQTVLNRSYGYARADKSRLLTPDYRFDIGSISKEFNGVGILWLKEKGKLSLDDPISRYLVLPEWGNRVKIRHLIQYTSGIPESPDYPDEAADLTWLRNLKTLAFSPGEGYLYTHPNVFLQQKIIEKVSGMSYARFVETHFLKPLGMTHTGVDLPIGDSLVAEGFSNGFEPLRYETRSTGWVRPTTADLLKWMEAIYRNRLISTESTQQLAEAYGFGESSLGTVRFENGAFVSHYHQGSNHGFEGMIYRNAREDIVIILLTNNQNMRVGALRDVIESVLLHKPYIVPKKSLYLDIREKMLADFPAGIAMLNTLRETQQDTYDFNAEKYELFTTGKYLMRRDRLEDAIALFQLSAMLFGASREVTNPYEFIGQCYRKKGNLPLALLYFQKAAEADPENKNARAAWESGRKLKP